MGKTVTIDVVGVDKILKDVKTLKQAKNLKLAISKATAIVESQAKNLCPVDTGNLRSSIHSQTIDEGLTGKVYTNTEYAPYVEFGTGQRGISSGYEKSNELGLSYRADWAGQEAQPFMYPALKQNKAKINTMIKEAIGEEL